MRENFVFFFTPDIGRCNKVRPPWRWLKESSWFTWKLKGTFLRFELLILLDRSDPSGGNSDSLTVGNDEGGTISQKQSLTLFSTGINWASPLVYENIYCFLLINRRDNSPLLLSALNPRHLIRLFNIFLIPILGQSPIVEFLQYAIVEFDKFQCMVE